MNKNNWETRSSLTTHEGVEQLDDDRVVFYRRITSYSSKHPGWEKVTIDRAAQSITAESMAPNYDGSVSSPTVSVISPVEGSSEQTAFRVNLWETGGNGSARVEGFKTQCLRLLKSVQFQNWSE